ncbi:GNAT family N-acetyltransferase [Psychromarinibacter sp. C21-152]|uniref:GNAT family N-acetyltransferase n=1 Tax=Psychromarinibacter sediminicola TaxID=3033385 RepID=A0AAE3T9W0_9RHOB|nr:GNAT family N-acetyltransferase [Psychromarinibacter sediminicola]MDF0603050.1 GNAT family N-acetyltransferase [Psychromarinibacter sediminicola]
MTPAALAALHARCFTTPEPFSEAAFAAFLGDASCFLCAQDGGVVLGRAVAGEAELLTLAVDPARRRQGIGQKLLARFEAETARRGAGDAFLEVAADNRAALALYRGAGWAEAGRRPGYYRAPDGARTDAVILKKALRGA